MDSPLPSPRLARKASSMPPALTPVLKTLGLEEEDPEDVFEIHAKEGAGAFGRVFRASYRHDPTRLAALKVIPVALEAGQRGEDIENVRREIQFLRECDHPNVVAFYGAYYKDQALWVAMEYCGGGSVGDVSRRRRLGEDEIAVITRGALRGLAYLHARKKIHRDIKGGNILLTSAGEVKIADFGVSAQLKDTMSRRGTFVGTPYWMSPEMIQDSDYDYKSDIWSLGITIIELADQRPPLFDEHPMRVLIQIPRNPPPSVKTPLAWTPLFSQFLQFCLRKDPKERPGAAECLEHAFIQRVHDVPFVYAEGYEAKRAETEAAANAPVSEANTTTQEAGSSTTVASRSLGSLTASASDTDAMADDVTLKASAARPPKVSKAVQPSTQASPSGDPSVGIASQRHRSVEREAQILSSEPPPKDGTEDEASDADVSVVGTPRESESVVDEVWDLSRSAALTSSRSSRSSLSDDDITEGNDASAEGFAFRHAPTSSASTPAPSASQTTAAAASPQPPALEMVSGDELLQLSVDDSFEMPAMALISKIHAAASTLAGQSTRPRATPSTAAPLPLPLPSAPSPVLKVPRKTVVDEQRLPTSPSNDAPVRHPRRELNSFSRTDSIGRATSIVGGVAPDRHSHGKSSETWSNPLAQLTPPSHDRVNSLLSSLSASTTRLLLHQPPPSHHVDSSMEFSPHGNSLRGESRPPALPTMSTSLEFTGTAASSSHFIGAPFRVSHELNVRYNTLDAKFEGVPSGSDWASVHKQFGLALAQMRCRSASTDRVPALVHMLRRELLKRDGLDCKYIYRVSPDQSEIQRAKLAINSGTFEPASVSDPHVFASLLKHWLRELPTPLLAAIPRNELAETVQKLVKPEDSDKAGNGANESPKEVVFAMAFTDVHAFITNRLLAKLPAPERGVLLWLVDHMLEVIAKSDRNAMTAHSLAVVLAPNVYRWASTTPADASLISKQVAMLLRVLLAWRQRCRGGDASRESVGPGVADQLPVRSPPTWKSNAPSPDVRDRTLSGMPTSLRESLHGLRSSLTVRGNAPRDSTVSSILRRSSGPAAVSTHFTSVSSGVVHRLDVSDAPKQSTKPQMDRSLPLDTLLRELVDGLWGELPLSIMLDDPPPIVRALHTRFQRNVLLLVKANGRRDQDRRWASEMLARLDDTAKASHLEKETSVPLSLRPLQRWILAALSLERFITLLQQERQVKERLEKRWPNHTTIRDTTYTAERTFGMAHILELAQSECASNGLSRKSENDASLIFDTQQVMLDGAATLLRVLHSSHADRSGVGTMSALPLAEELVAFGEQEPSLGNLLVMMSSQCTRRYHLEKQHRDVVRIVERVVQAGPLASAEK